MRPSPSPAEFTKRRPPRYGAPVLRVRNQEVLPQGRPAPAVGAPPPPPTPGPAPHIGAHHPPPIDALTLSGFASDAHELITDRRIRLDRGIVLEPWRVAWLRVRPAEAPPRF
jgi:hypothetical protein